MGSLALRPGDSLAIPRMALSVGFRTFGFPPVCDSGYRAPDSCPGAISSRWMRQPSAGRTLFSIFIREPVELVDAQQPADQAASRRWIGGEDLRDAVGRRPEPGRRGAISRVDRWAHRPATCGFAPRCSS